MQHWFISDTHFGHSSILKHSSRPFVSIEEHDECLIENWNRWIGSKDNVYFLGDFCWLNKDDTLKIRKRLNGNIHFIRGNHDRSAHQIRHTFIWFKDVHMIKVYDQQIWLSHYAHRVWNKIHYGTWHCFGHSHNSLSDDPTSPSMDVGIDATAARLNGLPEDYRPISYEEVAEILAKKKFVPVDHHK